MTSIIFDANTMNNIKVDSLKFGTALVLADVFVGNSLFKDDCGNMKVVFLSLLGYAIYQAIISKIVVTDSFKFNIKIAIDDVLKNATMMFVLYTSQPENTNFKTYTTNLLTSYLVYDSFVGNHLTSRLMSDKMSLKTVLTISDVVKYSFVMLSTGLLNELALGDHFNTTYMLRTLGYVSGLSVYNYFMS